MSLRDTMRHSRGAFLGLLGLLTLGVTACSQSHRREQCGDVLCEVGAACCTGCDGARRCVAEGESCGCADDAGIRDASIDPPRCGSLEGPGCPAGYYCDTGPSCSSEGFGQCRLQPNLCPDLYDPVCGCDGANYSNACDAAAVGVAVASEGECDRLACGTLGGGRCVSDEYCRFDPGTCGRLDGGGDCTLPPSDCLGETGQVCGCDGATYASACDAAQSGVSVDFEGGCDPRGCGGWLGDTCDEDEFCDFAGDGCDWADASGVCQPRPECLDPGGAPHCGCDAMTYLSLCSAQASGTDAAHMGACEP